MKITFAARPVSQPKGREAIPIPGCGGCPSNLSPSCMWWCASSSLCRHACGLPARLIASWPDRQAALLPGGLQGICKVCPARHRPDSGRESALGLSRYLCKHLSDTIIYQSVSRLVCLSVCLSARLPACLPNLQWSGKESRIETT